MEDLSARLEQLLSDPQRLAEMGRNAKEMAILDASERITDCICKIV